jgi:predicted dehydrogenase
MIRNGEYGPPHFVHGHYLQDWLLLETDWNWRIQESANGSSRAVADIGSHWADLVQHLTGERVSEVLADLGTLHHTRLPPSQDGGTFSAGGEPVEVSSEDFGTVLVRFESGARGAFAVSQTSAGRKNGLSFQVDTSQAAFAWNQENPERAWVGRRTGPNLELVRDPANLDPAAAGLAHLPAGHPEGWSDALRNVFDDFYGAIAARRFGREHETRVAGFRDGHARVLLVEAVMRSHREQRWTRVETATELAA